MQSITGWFAGSGDSRSPKNDRGPSSVSMKTPENPWGVYKAKDHPNLPDDRQDSNSHKIEVDPNYSSYSLEDKSNMPLNKNQTNSSAPVRTVQGQTYNNAGIAKKGTYTRGNGSTYMHDTRQESPDIHSKSAGTRGERAQRILHDKRVDSSSRHNNKRPEDEIRRRVEAQLEEEHRETCEAMLAQIEQNRKLLEDNKIQLTKLEDAYRHSQATLEESRLVFSRKEQEAQAVISELKSNINDLTVSVSRTVNANGITTRDDDYFEAEFASLKNSIHQWARQSFCQTDAVTYDQLPPRISNLLGVGIDGFEIPHGSRIGSAEFEAIMGYTMLFDIIFEPRFLLPWESIARSQQSGSYQRPEMMNILQYHLGGTDLEKRELFAQTIAMLFAHHEYDGFLNSNIQTAQMILQDLSNSLLPLEGAKLDKSAKRLVSIISKATQLHKETFQQVSPFVLYGVKPGNLYDPSFMEALNLPDIDETSSRHYVQTVLFPPVYRIGFNTTGNLEWDHRVLIRKGVVKCFLEKS
ncbi:hypothetical protein DFP73DRAFT_631918 [Morchella snyderi]|nr:hypothetical protein DFP73DRAFT_631918 [Morchella snyderi]